LIFQIYFGFLKLLFFYLPGQIPTLEASQQQMYAVGEVSQLMACPLGIADVQPPRAVAHRGPAWGKEPTAEPAWDPRGCCANSKQQTRSSRGKSRQRHSPIPPAPKHTNQFERGRAGWPHVGRLVRPSWVTVGGVAWARRGRSQVTPRQVFGSRGPIQNRWFAEMHHPVKYWKGLGQNHDPNFGETVALINWDSS
jgi:hypothetical protein